MTILNGEPIETPNISAGPAPGKADGPEPVYEGIASVMGLASLIFAFVFAPAGLVLGILSRKRSKQAGARNPLAAWGIVLSILVMILVVAAIVAFVVLMAGTLSSVIDICRELGPGVHQNNGVTYECNVRA